MTNSETEPQAKTLYAMAISSGALRRGIVEVFNIYDHAYYAIALDGEFIDGCDKHESYLSKIMADSFQSKCAAKAGVALSELLFVHIEYETYARGILDDDYDANDITYDGAMALAAVNGTSKLSMRILSDGPSNLGK